MKKILSLLVLVLFIGMFFSCDEKGNKETPKETPKETQEKAPEEVQKDTPKITKENIYQFAGLRDIPKIIDELAQKGLNTTPMSLTKPDEYLVGLYKLNQLTEEEINEVKELKLITIWVDDHFSTRQPDKEKAYLLIDHQASVDKIKNYLKNNAAFVYNEHPEEVEAYKKCKEIANFLGLNKVRKDTFISWRECLIGFKKLTLLSKHQIEVINLRGVAIEINDEFEFWWISNDTLVIGIDYKASLEEIIEYLHINF